MIKKETRKKLDEMKTTDVYSLVLFALYKLTGVSGYSSLSELAYILDRQSLFNLLEYYGGQTITIPTMADLRRVIDGLLLYQLVKFEGIGLNEALKTLDKTEEQQKDIKKVYADLVDILDRYDFRRQ